jgi:hypothetical protein
MTDKNGDVYATGASEKLGSMYPILQHVLAGELLTLPYNDYLAWMPVIVFGYGMEVNEYQHARLGDLDDIWSNGHDC